jgi:hypothetical protein
MFLEKRIFGNKYVLKQLGSIPESEALNWNIIKSLENM